jgi:hypothetical protein
LASGWLRHCLIYDIPRNYALSGPPGRRINLFVLMVLVILGDERSCPKLHHDELSARERAVLFALLSAARKLSNAELQALIGIRLDGKERRKLNDLKLVESEKPGRWFVHELSDAGWRWCADELAAGPEGRPTSLERSLYLMLGMFERYMAAARLNLADVASLDLKARPSGRHKRRDTAEGDGDLTARVAAAYQALTPGPGEFVKLWELRERLADIPRPALDGALGAMFTARRVNLIPQSNQQALTAADRESALRIGGEHKHLISFE